MIKILGKIDLPSPERNKKTFEKRSDEDILKLLDVGMHKSVQRINDRISAHGFEYGVLVNKEGVIDMNAFENNAYSGGDIEFDHMQVLEQKRYIYQSHKPDTQAKYGTSDEYEVIAMREQEERMRDGRISEEVLFVTLTKVLGDRYVPMRASEYDDYINGADLLLVDTQTGKPICAFDKTVESAASRKPHKIKRAKEKLLKGHGMRMKYGVTIHKDNGVKLGNIDNIPPLFLAINKADLDILKHTSHFDIDSPLSDDERRIVQSLIKGVREDMHILSSSSSSNTISYDAVHDMLEELEERLSA